LLASCGTAPERDGGPPPVVAETPTRARTPQGQYISWKEHLIDNEAINGGVSVRGGDGIQMADFDKDGHNDFVTVHEDSGHVRIAFGSANPDQWELITVAEGAEAKAAEDVAVADLNADGYPDLIVACELAHLLYLQNPGREARVRRWERVIPVNFQGRGSFIRVFFADLNTDGRVEVVTANKGEQNPVIKPGDKEGKEHPLKEISWIEPPSDPLRPNGWTEHVLGRTRIPVNAQPVDLDGDGDLDVLAGSRFEQRMWWYENLGGGAKPAFGERRIDVQGGRRLTAFMAAFHDLNRDGRLDIVLCEKPNVLWIEQPADRNSPWRRHSIGGIAPDAPTGIQIADINGDGNMDVVTGAYSGYPRDRDGDDVTAESVAGRISWFENPGDPAGAWPRHDMVRTKRGMDDGFVAYDLDKDGDIDFLGTRGNSSNFDGVFWLEQVRTAAPARAFVPARKVESMHLPLPKSEWAQ